MKDLKNIVLDCDYNDEKIDNMCVDEFILYLKDDSIEKSIRIRNSLLNLKNSKDYDLLGTSMKQKLSESRNKGKKGWWSELCHVITLENLYNNKKMTNDKNKDIDLCIYSMFLLFKKNSSIECDGKKQ